MRAISAAIASAMAAGLSAPALAHHSFAEFNVQRLIQLEGEITEIRWRNPHVTARLEVTRDDETVTWDLELESVGMFRRMGVGPDVMNVGDHVKVAGSPALDGARSIYAQNILLASGRELVTRGQPLFGGEPVGDLASWSTVEGSTARPERGLFRVWSTTMASQLVMVSDTAQADPAAVLTPAAQLAIAAFDPVASSREIGCAHKGMPRIMQQPDDLAFVEDGEDILLKIEEYDTVRRIDMTPDEDRASKPLTTLGYSSGVWEGRTLVVTTTGVEEPAVQWSLPQSDQIRIVERFTPSEDGSALQYELTVSDPVYFNTPLHFAKVWISIEGAEIDPYECTE